MTNDDFTPETPEDDMLGDNALKNEKALGAEALKAMRDVEKLFNKHDKLIGQIHAGIIEFGEKLSIGREIYEFDNDGFAGWVTRSKLDTGRIFGRRQERTAAMTIYNLVVHGYDTGEEGALPEKLDLTNCKRARPTDIVDWARREQPMLFADLRERKLRAKQSGKPKDDPKKPAPEDEADLPPDEIRDLGGNDDDPLDDLLSRAAKLMLELPQKERVVNVVYLMRLAEIDERDWRAEFTTEAEPQPAPAVSKLTWTGNDVVGFIAKSDSGLTYEVKSVGKRAIKWNVVVYEPGSDGQRLNKNPFATSTEAIAAVEAYYAERVQA